jgi:hypothetical protein
MTTHISVKGVTFQKISGRDAIADFFDGDIARYPLVTPFSLFGIGTKEDTPNTVYLIDSLSDECQGLTLSGPELVPIETCRLISHLAGDELRLGMLIDQLQRHMPDVPQQHDLWDGWHYVVFRQDNNGKVSVDVVEEANYKEPSLHDIIYSNEPPEEAQSALAMATALLAFMGEQFDRSDEALITAHQILKTQSAAVPGFTLNPLVA